MSHPLVSVCIPVYNVERYIERCVVSVLDQSYPDIECVFVDDSSPDSSVDKLKEVLRRYPSSVDRVKIIRHEKNRGLSAARNTALCHSAGDFILHVDSDDYLDIHAVENLVRKQEETDADIVTGQAVCIEKERAWVMERPHFQSREDFIADMVKPSIHHTIWGRLIRKSLYTDNGVQAKEGVNIGEDLQVMSQLAYYAGQVESIWDVVCFYDCTNDLSYMNQFDTRHIKRQLQDTESMEVVRDFFKDKDASLCDLAEKYLFQYYSSLLRYYGRAGMKEEFAGIRTRLSGLLPQNRKMSQRKVIKYRSYQLFRIADSLKHR